MIQNDLFDSAEERLASEVRQLDKEIGLLNSKRNILYKQLKETCQHDKKYLKKEESYYGGDYYNTAYTDYWAVCTLCGETSDKKTKNHSWYG